MQPHDLVKKLFEQRDDIPSVSALARAIHNQGFQGTLHKFLSGHTTSPDHETAARIAKFFDLPIEAIYDAKVATRIAKEKGLLPAGSTAASAMVRESDPPPYSRPAAPWPFRHVSATDLAKLSPPAQRQLERLIVAFMGGPVPSQDESDSWRTIARTLATTMDQALGKDVYSAFVLKVDELAQGALPQGQKAGVLAS